MLFFISLFSFISGLLGIMPKHIKKIFVTMNYFFFSSGDLLVRDFGWEVESDSKEFPKFCEMYNEI